MSETPMIDLPTIVHTAVQTAAVVHIVVPKDQIRNAMGPGRQELMSTLAAQGIVPTGPWFTHHLRLSSEVWDFEIGVPIDRPVTPTGRVEAGRLPAATVARTVYHGGYEGLGAAWGQLMKWIEGSGHVAADSLWETYLGENPFRTELTRPLIK